MTQPAITDDQIREELEWVRKTLTNHSKIRGYGFGVDPSDHDKRVVLLFVTTEADREIVLQDQAIPKQIEFFNLGLTLPVVVEATGEVQIQAKSVPAV